MGARIKSALLLGLLTAIFLAVGFFFGGVFGATVGIIVAFVMNFVSYWYSDKIILWMYKARKSDNRKINSMVEKLAKKAEIPKPQVYFVDTDIPNAFATGRSPKHSAVAVTKGLVDKLEDDEIEGVLAHEISHIKNRDTLISTIAATLAGALTWLAYLFYFGDDDRNALSFILFFILAPLAASLIRMSISRSREYLADQAGAVLSDPDALADALEKISSDVKARPAKGNASTAHMFIVNPFSASGITEMFSTHPPTEKRVAALREMAK